MKRTFFIYVAAFALLATSCATGTGNATQAELDAAREAGTRHGEAAAALPSQTMQREKAIFEIRARETRLRNAGFDECADAYIEAAHQALSSK